MLKHRRQKPQLLFPVLVVEKGSIAVYAVHQRTRHFSCKKSEMLLMFLMLFWFCCFSLLTKNRDEMHGAFSGNFKYKVNLKKLNIFTNGAS